jgi:hypothetical protein
MMKALVIFSAVKLIQPMCDLVPNFKQWSVMHNKSYAPTERDYRETIYNANVKTLSAGNTSWITGVDEFSDRTTAELASKNLTVVAKMTRRSLRGSV